MNAGKYGFTHTPKDTQSRFIVLPYAAAFSPQVSTHGTKSSALI